MGNNLIPVDKELEDFTNYRVPYQASNLEGGFEKRVAKIVDQGNPLCGLDKQDIAAYRVDAG